MDNENRLICGRCKKKFTKIKNYKQVYCSSSCKIEAQREQARITSKKKRDEEKQKQEYKQQNKLSTINAKARELGLTYGQYVQYCAKAN